MGEAVLISIQPKWCELIASGKKTVEIRKTRPKLETPFKCYIYCTKGNLSYSTPNGMVCHNNGGMVVIGEFTCDRVFRGSENYSIFFWDICVPSCLAEDAVITYQGDASEVYGWHISDLKLFERPKELSEFWMPPEMYCEKGLCGGCPYNCVPGESGDFMFDCEWKRPLKRAPRSWCYVEELKGGGEG